MIDTTAGSVDCILTYCRATLVDQTLLGGGTMARLASLNIGVRTCNNIYKYIAIFNNIYQYLTISTYT